MNRLIPAYIPAFLLAAFVCNTLAQAQSRIREAPKVIDQAEAGIGHAIPDLEFEDIDGNEATIGQLADGNLLVICLTGTSCPLCRRFAPSLGQIEAEYGKRGVRFLYINPNNVEKPERIRKAIQANALKGPYVRDKEHALVRALGAKTTTEVIVLDAELSVAYRGAVDDQYGIGYSLKKPRHSYLRDALDRRRAPIGRPRVQGRDL